MLSFVSPNSPIVFSTSAELDKPVPVCLFFSGEYADKGVTITPADLDLVVSRFQDANSTVGVRTEHEGGLFDPLGEVAALFHRDGKLYGSIVFSSGVHKLLKDRDAGKFSIGLQAHEEGGFVLDHVAVTRTPRVEGTGFLSPVAVAEKVAHFSVQGKLTPATAQIAARILSTPSVIMFSDGSTGSVTSDFEAFLDALPVVQPRGAAVPGATFSRSESNAITPEIKTLAERHGVDANKLAANLVAGRGR